MHMPIDNHVHAKLRCPINSIAHNLFQLGLVSAVAITVVITRIQYKAHAIYVPIITQSLESIFVHIAAEIISEIDSVSAHSIELIFFVVLVIKICTVHMKRTMICKRSTGHRCWLWICRHACFSVFSFTGTRCRTGR